MCVLIRHYHVLVFTVYALMLIQLLRHAVNAKRGSKQQIRTHTMTYIWDQIYHFRTDDPDVFWCLTKIYQLRNGHLHFFAPIQHLWWRNYHVHFFALLQYTYPRYFDEWGSSCISLHRSKVYDQSIMVKEWVFAICCRDPGYTTNQLWWRNRIYISLRRSRYTTN